MKSDRDAALKGSVSIPLLSLFDGPPRALSQQFASGEEEEEVLCVCICARGTAPLSFFSGGTIQDTRDKWDT